MVYDQAATSGEHPLESKFLKSKFDRIESRLISVEVSQNRFTDYLLQFARIEAWTHSSLDEIFQNKLQNDVENIYIDDLFSKRYEPNLIFEQVRLRLPVSGYFAFKVVTAENIKSKLQEKYSSAFLPYYLIHFLFKRLLPKLSGFKWLYTLLAIHADISKAEIIGRSVFKGFKIVDLFESQDETTIIAQIDSSFNIHTKRKVPSTGFLLRMNRLGKQGKQIVVYKFRSMHPYAEYVQAYLHKKNGLDKGGKFKDDFRVSSGGRLIRKYWIDELPMLYNLIRGDIKLIGVRPLSEHYFSLYPPEVQLIREKHRPGLLPPFYADLPGTFDEIIQSELQYLNQYEKAPFNTDLRYFLRILENILLKKARSK